MREDLPQIIKEVGFDFSWDEKKVWQLDVPVTEMNLSELEWHFDIPFLWWGRGIYNLTPRTVMEKPADYPKEYERTMKADIKFPIDIMENKGRWLILDGLHRLMRLYVLGEKKIRVRIISRDRIADI